MNKYWIKVVILAIFATSPTALAAYDGGDLFSSVGSLISKNTTLSSILNRDLLSDEPTEDTDTSLVGEKDEAVYETISGNYRSYIVTITAYSSSVDETDDTPFITASGSRTRDGVVAANFLSFGSKVQIPELFGNKTFLVEDRMNRRYTERLDIWFPSKWEAKQFGRRTAQILAYEGI